MSRTNTWFSKIALAQHVVRRLFPEALGPAARAAGRNAMGDQIRTDTGITYGSRVCPRGATTILRMRK